MLDQINFVINDYIPPGCMMIIPPRQSTQISSPFYVLAGTKLYEFQVQPNEEPNIKLVEITELA